MSTKQLSTHRELHVDAIGGGYPVYIAPRGSLPELLKKHGDSNKRCFVITDDNVAELYGAEVESLLEDAGFDVAMHIVPPGETAKDLDNLAALYRWSFANDIDRRSPVIAFGGGVVGDLAGFFAATVLRGVPLVHLPTTLVAQVDSSIGGKTGVNHQSGKNLIGSMYRPLFVLSDASLLDSLPDVEWRNGLAEVLKHALIRDRSFYEALRSDWAGIVERSGGAARELVDRAVRIKIDVVEQDERETGLRRILNFGHTFGHAIERIAGYGVIGHGSAVALGMRAAIHASSKRGYSIPVAEVDDLLLPLRPAELPRMPIDWLMQSMRKDKKRVGDILHLILLSEIGQALVVDDATEDEIRAALEFALS